MKDHFGLVVTDLLIAESAKRAFGFGFVKNPLMAAAERRFLPIRVKGANPPPYGLARTSESVNCSRDSLDVSIKLTAFACNRDLN